MVVNKPVGGQEVEEEERDEAVSFYFAGLFGEDDDLDMEESAKGSPIYNPPDPNAEQLTLRNLEVCFIIIIYKYILLFYFIIVFMDSSNRLIAKWKKK